MRASRSAAARSNCSSCTYACSCTSCAAMRSCRLCSSCWRSEGSWAPPPPQLPPPAPSALGCRLLRGSSLRLAVMRGDDLGSSRACGEAWGRAANVGRGSSMVLGYSDGSDHLPRTPTCPEQTGLQQQAWDRFGGLPNIMAAHAAAPVCFIGIVGHCSSCACRAKLGHHCTAARRVLCAGSLASWSLLRPPCASLRSLPCSSEWRKAKGTPIGRPMEPALPTHGRCPLTTKPGSLDGHDQFERDAARRDGAHCIETAIPALTTSTPQAPFCCGLPHGGH